MIEVRKKDKAPPDFGVLSDMYAKCFRMVAYRKNDGETEGEAFDLLAEIEAIYNERLALLQQDMGEAEETKELGAMKNWALLLVSVQVQVQSFVVVNSSLCGVRAVPWGRLMIPSRMKRR